MDDLFRLLIPYFDQRWKETLREFRVSENLVTWTEIKDSAKVPCKGCQLLKEIIKKKTLRAPTRRR